MAKMRAGQVSSPHGPLELVERDVPEPGPVDFRVSIFIERALNRRKT